MNINLNKYLQEVFRKEVKGPVQSNNPMGNVQSQKPLNDQHQNHFLIDKKYSLRLDEII